MVVFHAEVHSLLVVTLLVGSECLRLISVDPRCPTFSVTGVTWWSELRTTSRLTGLLLMMCSHSDGGNPCGVLCEVRIHCLTVLKSFLSSLRISLVVVQLGLAVSCAVASL